METHELFPLVNNCLKITEIRYAVIGLLHDLGAPPFAFVFATGSWLTWEDF